MNKSSNVVVSFLFMFLAILGLSGCIFILGTPEISINGSVVSWNSVANAGSYEVDLSDGTYDTTITTTATSIDLASYLSVGTWSVKVKARSQSLIRSDSEYSDELSLSVSGALTTPNGLTVQEDDGNIIVTWNGVVGAQGYTIKIGMQGSGEQAITVYSNGISTTKDITSYLTQGGVYEISICANASEYVGETGVFVSAYSVVATYELEVQLISPVISDFKKVINAYTLSWEAVSGATGYRVSLLGTDETIYTTNTSVDVSTIQGGLPSIAKVDGVDSPSALQIAFVQAVGTGYCVTSDYSLGVVYYGLTATQSNYEKIDVNYFYSDFNGVETFDFCADTQNELDALVIYAIYYRLDTIKFYQNFTDSNAISKAFNEYAEIMSLTRWTSGVDLITMRMEYDTPSTPKHTATETYEGKETDITQIDYGTISSYSTTPRSDDSGYTKEDLPIYDRTKSMNVYTSEQLFQAVQAGYLPVIVGDCGAKTIWDTACQVAMNIIDDSMTDYEKVLAIFDWVCSTNQYDWNLYSYTEAQAEMLSTSVEYQEIEDALRNFKGFYLEGMFLDNGQAVCDGISKAFSLLCGIENIEAYKVNGTVSGGGHAWNKVALDLDGNGTGEWYTIDCTWNDVYDIQENDTTKTGNEWLTHNYFLVTDSSISSDHVEQWPNRDVSSTAFDYFTTTKVTIESTTYDMYIETSGEIDALIDYLCINFDNFEVRVYTSDLSGALRWNNTKNEITAQSGWTYKQVDSGGSFLTLVAYKMSYS